MRSASTRFSFLLVLSSLCFSVAPAPGFRALPAPFLEGTPELSPWWAVIAIGAASLLFWMIRRFITAHFQKRDRELTAKLKQLDDEEAERNRRFELEMARIAGQQTAEQAASQQIGALTSSIYEMARSVTQAHLSSSDDRQQAAAERAEFRDVLSGNSERLGENTGELAQVKAAVDALATTLAAVQKRIGQSKDERTLMQIAEDLVVSVQEAVTTIRQAADASSPRLPIPPAIHLVPSEESHEAPGS